MRLWRNFLNKFKYIDYINETLFNDLKNNERNLSIFSEFGFKNIIISIFDENINENKLNNINKLSNENIDYCLQINNDKINEIYTIIKKYKSKIPYISLKSSNENTIRKALEIKDINIIIPSSDNNIARCNQTIAKIAYQKNIIFCFEIENILKSNSYNKCKYISSVINMIDILRKYDVKFMLISNATSIFDFKDLYSITSISKMLGFNDKECSKKYRLEIMKLLFENNYK